MALSPTTKRILWVGGLSAVGVGVLALVARKASASTGPGPNVTKGGVLLLDGAQANNACNSKAGPGHDGFISEVPPAEVQDALNPDTISAGAWSGGPVYAYFKGDIWRFSNPMGYAKCANVNKAALGVGRAHPGYPVQKRRAA